MKRMFYVSRFAQPLTAEDIGKIRDSAVRYNHAQDVTGALVCMGTTFLQVIEGENDDIDRLYNERILRDRRHEVIYCIKTENNVRERMFPHWDMQVFNLNEDAGIMPMVFRQMLIALLESSQLIAQYTQPSVLRMLERGINPTTIKPARKEALVLFSDVIGFSLFAERLRSAELIELVDQHAAVCTDQVDRRGGEVNKLLGDGVMAYFPGEQTDAAVAAASGIVKELAVVRGQAPADSALHLLYGGVGLTHGLVYEGNIGPYLKRDFTILGNTVNLASRLESLSRDLDTLFVTSSAVVQRARQYRSFRSLGKHQLKGQSRAIEVFGLEQAGSLDIAGLYDRIDHFLANR